jgi:hypothetical protein
LIALDSRLRGNDEIELISVTLSRINLPFRNHAQCRHAWDEKVITASRLDKPWNVLHEVRWLVTVRINGKNGFAWVLFAMIAEDDFFVVAFFKIIPVIDPLLLHKLELAVDVGVQHHDDDAVITVIFCTVFDITIR